MILLRSFALTASPKFCSSLRIWASSFDLAPAPALDFVFSAGATSTKAVRTRQMLTLLLMNVPPVIGEQLNTREENASRQRTALLQVLRQCCAMSQVSATGFWLLG